MAEDKFGKTDDQVSQSEGFNQEPSDKDGKTDRVDITSHDLEELRKRDESAQTFIEQLKTENQDLREDKESLSNALSSAATLEDVMTRIGDSDQGETSGSVDPSKVADAVEARLQRKAAQEVAESNWDSVVSKLSETYGEWEKADVEITSRCKTLGMSPQEATDLASRSPTAFYELFLPKSSSEVGQSSVNSATSRQTSERLDAQTNERDRAYYNDMRKKNPNKYWGVENQKQLRRDLYGAS